jgi:hypothetical protein
VPWPWPARNALPAIGLQCYALTERGTVAALWRGSFCTLSAPSSGSAPTCRCAEQLTNPPVVLPVQSSNAGEWVPPSRIVCASPRRSFRSRPVKSGILDCFWLRFGWVSQPFRFMVGPAWSAWCSLGLSEQSCEPDHPAGPRPEGQACAVAWRLNRRILSCSPRLSSRACGGRPPFQELQGVRL